MLTFLVVRSEANGVALRWANDVLADVAAADYVDGQPWKPPKRWSGARQALVTQFESLLRGMSPEDAQASGEAAHQRARSDSAAPGATEIKNYMLALFAPTTAKNVLLGAGGGGTYKKGAPLRRLYIMPRIAQLVRGADDEIVPALGAARDVVIARAVEQRGSIRVEPSPSKAAVKAECDELKAQLAAGAAAQHAAELDYRSARQRIARLVRTRVAAQRERARDVARRAAAATACATADARATTETIARERDAALARASVAEAEVRKLRKDRTRLKARASDASALRRKNDELAALRAENSKLVREQAKLEQEVAAARADAATARREYGKVRLPQRARGNGAGRGRAWPAWFRRLLMQLLVYNVAPNMLPHVVVACAEARKLS